MQSVKPEFDRRGVRVIVVSFAHPEKLRPYQDYHKWPFVILADPNRTAYQAFSLTRLCWFRVFSPSTVKLYLKLLRQGTKRRDYGKEDIYQAGGDFLIDRQGRILFAHRGQEPADRPSSAKLLQEVERATK